MHRLRQKNPLNPQQIAKAFLLPQRDLKLKNHSWQFILIINGVFLCLNPSQGIMRIIQLRPDFNLLFIATSAMTGIEAAL
jgi:hypothetical protein